MMNSQRGRGLKLKRALQFATLLAICIWLLYQINHPVDKSSQSKSSKKPSIFLGRKVNMGWLARDSEGENIIKKSKNWESGALDDELVQSHQEKVKEIKGEDLTAVQNKTGEFNLDMELEDKDDIFPRIIDNPLQHTSFDDENGVPVGFDHET